jgi:hypothetical protein
MMTFWLEVNMVLLLPWKTKKIKAVSDCYCILSKDVTAILVDTMLKPLEESLTKITEGQNFVILEKKVILLTRIFCNHRNVSLPMLLHSLLLRSL